MSGARCERVEIGEAEKKGRDEGMGREKMKGHGAGRGRLESDDHDSFYSARKAWGTGPKGKKERLS